ncbi:MAG: response regulator [Bacillota bacterium]
MASIMVADDAVIIKKMLHDILAQEGHKIVAGASTGGEVMRSYEACNPDLLFLDITMPEGDGVQILRKLMLRHPQAKVIMCSAMGDQRIVRECIKAGAAGFITKPFNPRQVIEVVNQVLGK